MRASCCLMEEEEMKKRSVWVIVVIALLLASGGGYFVYTRYVPVRAPEIPTLETATVTRGDIVLTASGSGELIAAREMNVTFRTAGTLAEMLVEAGDRVKKGEMLARLETADLERALTEAEVELELDRLALADVREGPSEAELSQARATLRNAEVELTLAQKAYEDTFDSRLDDLVADAKTEYDWYVGYYQGKKAAYEEGNLSQSDHDHAMNAMISAEGRWIEAQNNARVEEMQAANRVAQARDGVVEARENLEALQGEPSPDTLTLAELAVDEALLAREAAKADLEAAQLSAPFDGTVMGVGAEAGDQVGVSTSIVALADLQEPRLRFWVQEADMSRVAAGLQVNVVFEAWPDHAFTGTVVRVKPVLVQVSGTPAVQSEARLYVDEHDVVLLSGLTAEVEVIAAEARGVLLVPVEALQETAEGKVTVSVVQPDGELETRAVEVGLRDAVYAEILAGLELGESVSTER